MSKPLSFGVEFEFLVAVVPSGCVDPLPNDPRPVDYGNSGDYLGYPFPHVPSSEDVVRQGDIHHTARYRVQRSIARALSRVGLPALSDEYEDFWNPMNGTFYTDTPSAADPWGLAGLVGLYESRRWAVSIDGSIASPDKKDKNYEWHKIEVKSPAYYYSQHSLKAVQLALHTITSNFRCHINESCGFHVHVGSGVDGFRLSTIKNLMGLLWTFDDTVLTIHPWCRRFEYRWCANLRLQSLLGICGVEALRAIDDMANFREPRNYTTAIDGLLAMDSAESLADLAMLVHRHPKFDRDMRYAAYNLENAFTSIHDLRAYLAARNAARQRESSFRFSDGISDINMALNPNKRTIEFRQHEAALDSDRVTAWIQTAVGLIHLSRSTPATAMHTFLMEFGRASDIRYSFTEGSDGSADRAETDTGSRDGNQHARQFGGYITPALSMPDLLHGVGLHVPARYYEAFLAHNRTDADYVVGGLYRPRAWYNDAPAELDPWKREYEAGAYGVGGTQLTLPDEPPSPDTWGGADGGGFRSIADYFGRSGPHRTYVDDEEEERGRTRQASDGSDELEESYQEYYDVPQSPTSDGEAVRGGTRPAGQGMSVSLRDMSALDTSQWNAGNSNARRDE